MQLFYLRLPWGPSDTVTDSIRGPRLKSAEQTPTEIKFLELFIQCNFLIRGPPVALQAT